MFKFKHVNSYRNVAGFIFIINLHCTTFIIFQRLNIILRAVTTTTFISNCNHTIPPQHSQYHHNPTIHHTDTFFTHTLHHTTKPFLTTLPQPLFHHLNLYHTITTPFFTITVSPHHHLNPIALHRGDLHSLQDMHRKGLNMQSRDYDGRSALHVASSEGLGCGSVLHCVMRIF